MQGSMPPSTFYHPPFTELVDSPLAFRNERWTRPYFSCMNTLGNPPNHSCLQYTCVATLSSCFGFTRTRFDIGARRRRTKMGRRSTRTTRESLRIPGVCLLFIGLRIHTKYTDRGARSIGKHQKIKDTVREKKKLFL